MSPVNERSVYQGRKLKVVSNEHEFISEPEGSKTDWQGYLGGLVDNAVVKRPTREQGTMFAVSVRQ
jgi:hypothetical protein